MMRKGLAGFGLLFAGILPLIVNPASLGKTCGVFVWVFLLTFAGLCIRHLK